MRPAVLAVLALLLATPTALAHTSVFSSDGQYRVVIGQLEEPVVTYAKTGLDLCIQMNTTAREPVTTVNPGALTATLVSPTGATHTQALRAQFGRGGCFQFEEPYILTEAGQYTVDLTGSIGSTAVDFQDVAAGGPVKDSGNLTFPDSGVQDLRTLQARVQALESQVAVHDEHLEQEDNDAPGLGLAALLVVVALAVALRRR